MAKKLYDMSFKSVYQALNAKVLRKGKDQDEVDSLAAWLTGYSEDEIRNFLNTDSTYGDFFRGAPKLAAARKSITGNICGMRIEDIEEPLMQDVRRLDKLVDELAKGKKTAKELIRKYEMRFEKEKDVLATDKGKVIKDGADPSQYHQVTKVKSVPARNLVLLDDDLVAGDIILLWRIHFNTFTNQSWFPKYFEDSYGINGQEHLQQLIKRGFVIEETAFQSLKHVTVAQKKHILKMQGVRGFSTMKSAELDNVLKEHLSEEDLANCFDVRVYRLTDQGKMTLLQHQNVVDRHPKKKMGN